MPKRKTVQDKPSPLEVATEVYRATREPFYVISPADIKHPCTLRGLEAAMGQAGNLSIGGPDQLVIAARESGVKIIRRYSDGKVRDG